MSHLVYVAVNVFSNMMLGQLVGISPLILTLNMEDRLVVHDMGVCSWASKAGRGCAQRGRAENMTFPQW
jgi:hypothetical protein